MNYFNKFNPVNIQNLRKSTGIVRALHAMFGVVNKTPTSISAM